MHLSVINFQTAISEILLRCLSQFIRLPDLRFLNMKIYSLLLQTVRNVAVVKFRVWIIFSMYIIVILIYVLIALLCELKEILIHQKDLLVLIFGNPQQEWESQKRHIFRCNSSYSSRFVQMGEFQKRSG